MSIDLRQPTTTFINFEIGDVNISPIPPQFVQSFTYTRTTQDAANNFELTVFDESAIQLEEVIALGYDKVKFQYGWYGGKVSPFFSARILDYKLTFDAGGATLNIEGVSDTLNSHGSEVKKTYVEEDTVMHIDEILRDIIDRNENWIEGYIEPTAPIESESEPPYKYKVFKQQSIPDTKFIKTELLPLAKTKKDNKSGYKLWFTDSMEGTKVNFAPPRYDKVPKSTFTFKWNSYGGNVISFAPDFNGILHALQGAGNIKNSGLDPVTGELYSDTYNDSSNPRKDIPEKKRFNQQPFVLSQNVSSAEKDERIAKMASQYEKTVNEAYPATMEIFGDPELLPLETVTVIVLTRGGKLHHSSGIYFINQIVDTIDSGSFTSSLDLTRCASKVGEEDADGNKVGESDKGLTE